MSNQPSAETLAFVDDANVCIALAQAASVAAGVPIVYKDQQGRYVEEHPDGRVFEIRFRPEESGARHVEILRQLTGPAC